MLDEECITEEENFHDSEQNFKYRLTAHYRENGIILEISK